MKVDIKKLKCKNAEIYQLLNHCKDILGEDFEITINKVGVATKVKKGVIDDIEISLSVIYATYLSCVIDNYDNLSEVGKTLIDNQFESFGEMLK